MSRRLHTVACLSGDGTGPELIAEASRTLHSVARTHGFGIEDVHVPFGSEALTRSGHSLPAATRAASLEAEAILVASLADPTLAAVESELDLRARITRVVFRGERITVLAPLTADDEEWTLERAFLVARRSRGRLASVDLDERFADLVDSVAERHQGVEVEHLGVSDGITAAAFRPERLDVAVTGSVLGQALDEIVASRERRESVAACGRLAGNGPSVFSPAHTGSREAAGHGIADPGSMLLATSLLLAEGLHELRAAETLEAALASARAARPEPAGVTATTRELADAVLGRLHVSHRNAEYVEEGVS